MTRTGKIARLPREIREELNRRLQNGEPGKQLVVWLNSLPKVQATLKREFQGRSISEQNLSEWKRGGYADWLVRQETLADIGELSADAKELEGAGSGALADLVATVLIARYARLVTGWKGEATDEFRRKLRSLRCLCQDVMQLRRGDHSAGRLKIEQRRLERDREKTVEQFKRWAEDPKVRDLICRRDSSPEQMQLLVKLMFGEKPEDSDAPIL